MRLLVTFIMVLILSCGGREPEPAESVTPIPNATDIADDRAEALRAEFDAVANWAEHLTAVPAYSVEVQRELIDHGRPVLVRAIVSDVRSAPDGGVVQLDAAFGGDILDNKLTLRFNLKCTPEQLDQLVKARQAIADRKAPDSGSTGLFDGMRLGLPFFYSTAAVFAIAMIESVGKAQFGLEADGEFLGPGEGTSNWIWINTDRSVFIATGKLMKLEFE